MTIKWNKVVAHYEVQLTLQEIKDLIDEISRQEEKELIYEVLCHWSLSELDELKQWISEILE